LDYTCFQKHVYAFVDFLGKLLVKCIESPETFVEIPQKLEVWNRTKPFSVAEETLDNENLLLQSEHIVIANFNRIINNDNYHCNE
jgi:hypothetical protein